MKKYSTEKTRFYCSTYFGRVPRKNVTKTDIYWGSYRINILVFLTYLLIFVPLLEVLFFMNNYFLVCIFKYRTITRIFSLKILSQFWVKYLVVFPPSEPSVVASIEQKNNTRNNNSRG